jgi:hypothetical protein
MEDFLLRANGDIGRPSMVVLDQILKEQRRPTSIYHPRDGHNWMDQDKLHTGNRSKKGRQISRHISRRPLPVLRTQVYSLAIGTRFNFNTRSRNHVRLRISRYKTNIWRLAVDEHPYRFSSLSNVSCDRVRSSASGLNYVQK